MTKKIVLSVALAFVALASQAQEIGVRIGPNFSTIMYEEDPEGKKFLPGVHLGAFANFGILGDMLSLQPEVIFSQKGVATEGDLLSTKTRMNYLEVPVQLRAQFADTYFMGGPYFAYLMNATTTVEEGSNSVSTDWDFDEDENLNRTDLGICVAAGYTKGIGPVNFFLEGRYSVGMRRLVDEYTILVVTVDQKDYIHNISISAGITFGR